MNSMSKLCNLSVFTLSLSYKNGCKMVSRGDTSNVVLTIGDILSPNEMRWFREHRQFKHIFHMVKEPNRKLMGMWMFLIRTVKTEKRKQLWFVLNGVLIRYLIGEHALLSGLDCEAYPTNYKNLGSMDFVMRQFGNDKVEVADVLEKLKGMVCDNDWLKMVVLYFLSTVIKGKTKINGKIEHFILRIVDDLKLCEEFPWGHFTFGHCVEHINRMFTRFDGFVQKTLTFLGFILPLEVNSTYN